MTDAADACACASARRPWRIRQCRLFRLIAISLLSACATTSQVPPAPDSPYPSPLSGPGSPDLSRSVAREISEGWSSLVSGDLHEAQSRAAVAGGVAQARLLSSQVLLEQESYAESVMQLRELTEAYPGYASAWATLSRAAEAAGEEAVALEAARKTSSLWPRSRFASRTDELTSKWITERARAAEAALENDSYEIALEQAERVARLDPGRADTSLIRAQALIALSRIDEAEPILADLGGNPDALLLRSSIATNNRDYQHAMDLLSRLPDGDPRKAGALRRSRLQWRLSILPGSVQNALASDSLTRGELAVLLFALAPELENTAGGTTPLMPDVVDLPSQRAILTAARLGLITPDSVDGRFLPDKVAALPTVQRAVETTCRLVGYEAPTWCHDATVVTSDCHQLADPVSGRKLTEMILKLVEESNL